MSRIVAARLYSSYAASRASSRSCPHRRAHRSHTYTLFLRRTESIVRLHVPYRTQKNCAARRASHYRRAPPRSAPADTRSFWRRAAGRGFPHTLRTLSHSLTDFAMRRPSINCVRTAGAQRTLQCTRFHARKMPALGEDVRRQAPLCPCIMQTMASWPRSTQVCWPMSTHASSPIAVRVLEGTMTWSSAMGASRPTDTVKSTAPRSYRAEVPKYCA